MDSASTACRVHQCSECSGDTEHYCVSCTCDLCLHCKENHVKDLTTNDHEIIIYQDKKIPILRDCFNGHPNNVSGPNEPLVCSSSMPYTKLRNVGDLRKISETKKHHLTNTINIIRCESLFLSTVLLKETKADLKTCLTKIQLLKSDMLTKAQQLKECLIKPLRNCRCKHRCLKQMMRMNNHISTLQNYEHIFEQKKNKPVQYLLFIKKTDLPFMFIKMHTSQLSVTESLNKIDVMESLSAIIITEKENQ